MHPFRLRSNISEYPNDVILRALPTGYLIAPIGRFISE